MFRIFTLLLCLTQLAEGYTIRNITMPNTNFLAAPFWDHCTQNLFMVDFISPEGTNSIWQYEYNTGLFYGCSIIGEVNPSFIVSVKGKNHQFVLGFEGAIKLIYWDLISPNATVIRTLFTAFGHFNYATTDIKGRLYTGTIDYETFCSAPSQYATYRYDKGKVTTIFQGIKSTTGEEILEREGVYFHGDACSYKISAFKYDLKTGDVCNGRVVFDFSNSGIKPYPLILGITANRNGNLFVGFYETSQFWEIDPRTSTALRIFEIPSPGITDAVFGGPDIDKLFITAAKYLVNPYGGGVLAVTPNDPTLYVIEGLNTGGYKSPRVRVC